MAKEKFTSKAYKGLLEILEKNELDTKTKRLFTNLAEYFYSAGWDTIDEYIGKKEAQYTTSLPIITGIGD